MARALGERFDLVSVVSEESPSRRRLLRRRVLKLGAARVLNQLWFQGVFSPALTVASRGRANEIRQRFDLLAPGFPTGTLHVSSANAPEVRETLRALEPDVVVVQGTRILGKRLLSTVHAPFLNLHAGITPAYRGVHGGYWALAEQRADLCGATVHLVDVGIDTGRVLARAQVMPTDRDTYATYPLLQLAVGLPLLLDCVARVAAGDTSGPEPVSVDSELRHHPTATGYLRAWWMYGVR